MHLSKLQSQRFNRLFCGLLDYTNKKYNIDSWLDLSGGLPDKMESITAVKDFMMYSYVQDELV
jgi:hypothetical protein